MEVTWQGCFEILSSKNPNSRTLLLWSPSGGIEETNHIKSNEKDKTAREKKTLSYVGMLFWGLPPLCSILNQGSASFS